jgi:hypothetical protein
MATPPGIPVCNALCPATQIDPTKCQSLCTSRFANCPLTPSTLYTFVAGIFDVRDTLFAGIANSIESLASSLTLRLAIYQQIPWLIGFFILLTFLSFTGVMSTLTGFLIFTVAIFFVVIFVYFTVTDTTNTVRSIISNIETQIAGNYPDAIAKFSENSGDDLIASIFAASIRCPP